MGQCNEQLVKAPESWFEAADLGENFTPELQEKDRQLREKIAAKK
ncbi:MAG TPA: hypothetical protein VMH04_04965 [Candidatus Solibacter sp.]|nr:hypothetical protein [Candidatus Solibacter sp.]